MFPRSVPLEPQLFFKWAQKWPFEKGNRNLNAFLSHWRRLMSCPPYSLCLKETAYLNVHFYLRKAQLTTVRGDVHCQPTKSLMARSGWPQQNFHARLFLYIQGTRDRMSNCYDSKSNQNLRFLSYHLAKVAQS